MNVVRVGTSQELKKTPQLHAEHVPNCQKTQKTTTTTTNPSETKEKSPLYHHVAAKWHSIWTPQMKPLNN